MLILLLQTPVVAVLDIYALALTECKIPHPRCHIRHYAYIHQLPHRITLILISGSRGRTTLTCVPD